MFKTNRPDGIFNTETRRTQENKSNHKKQITKKTRTCLNTGGDTERTDGHSVFLSVPLCSACLSGYFLNVFFTTKALRALRYTKFFSVLFRVLRASVVFKFLFHHIVIGAK